MRLLKLIALGQILLLFPAWLSLGLLIQSERELVTHSGVDTKAGIFDAGASGDDKAGNPSSEDFQGYDVAVVFGASVINNEFPSSVLALRLDKAYELFLDQKINKIIVSGDTRNSNYNEPKVMKEYLVAKGIAEQNIIEDTQGTKTIDTCYRLKNIFHLNSVILITQDFHMPRANFLCRQMGLHTTIAPAPSSSDYVTLTGTVREYPALLYNMTLLLTKYDPSV